MPYYRCPRCERKLYTAASKGHCGKCGVRLQRVSDPTPLQEPNRSYLSVEARAQ